MGVDHSTVREMAALAQLAVDDAQLNAVADEMNSILEFMNQIERFPGAGLSDPPNSIRRRDDSSASHHGVRVRTENIDASGAVIVPPIKGAS